MIGEYMWEQLRAKRQRYEAMLRRKGPRRVRGHSAHSQREKLKLVDPTEVSLLEQMSKVRKVDESGEEALPWEGAGEGWEETFEDVAAFREEDYELVPEKDSELFGVEAGVRVGVAGPKRKYYAAADIFHGYVEMRVRQWVFRTDGTVTESFHLQARIEEGRVSAIGYPNLRPIDGQPATKDLTRQFHGILAARLYDVLLYNKAKFVTLVSVHRHRSPSIRGRTKEEVETAVRLRVALHNKFKESLWPNSTTVGKVPAKDWEKEWPKELQRAREWERRIREMQAQDPEAPPPSPPPAATAESDGDVEVIFDFVYPFVLLNDTLVGVSLDGEAKGGDKVSAMSIAEFTELMYDDGSPAPTGVDFAETTDLVEYMRPELDAARWAMDLGGTDHGKIWRVETGNLPEILRSPGAPPLEVDSDAKNAAAGLMGLLLDLATPFRVDYEAWAPDAAGTLFRVGRGSFEMTAEGPKGVDAGLIEKRWAEELACAEWETCTSECLGVINVIIRRKCTDEGYVAHGFHTDVFALSLERENDGIVDLILPCDKEAEMLAFEVLGDFPEETGFDPLHSRFVSSDLLVIEAELVYTDDPAVLPLQPEMPYFKSGVVPPEAPLLDREQLRKKPAAKPPRRPLPNDDEEDVPTPFDSMDARRAREISNLYTPDMDEEYINSPEMLERIQRLFGEQDSDSPRPPPIVDPFAGMPHNKGH